MNANDRVKLSIYCKVTGNIIIITSYQQAMDFKESVKGFTTDWVEISGQLNDIDGNEIESCISKEDIASFDILGVNEKF